MNFDAADAKITGAVTGFLFGLAASFLVWTALAPPSGPRDQSATLPAAYNRGVREGLVADAVLEHEMFRRGTPWTRPERMAWILDHLPLDSTKTALALPEKPAEHAPQDPAGSSGTPANEDAWACLVEAPGPQIESDLQITLDQTKIQAVLQADLLRGPLFVLPKTWTDPSGKKALTIKRPKDGRELDPSWWIIELLLAVHDGQSLVGELEVQKRDGTKGAIRMTLEPIEEPKRALAPLFIHKKVVPLDWPTDDREPDPRRPIEEPKAADP